MKISIKALLFCAGICGVLFHFPILAEDADKATPVVKRAKAEVHSTKGSTVSGTVWFTQEDDGVKVVADFDGLTPGKHGFHVHEKGDCSAPDAATAGGHFNPTKSLHGGPDSAIRHVGDLGNVEADAKGHGHYERVDKVIALSGKNNIVGLSVVIHADEDDLRTQPSGNSGARLGCGVIKADEP